MTIICVKDGIIAVDSRVVSAGWVVGGVDKLFRVNKSAGGGFVAGVGLYADVLRGIDFIMRGKTIPPGNKATCLHLDAEGRVWTHEDDAAFIIKAPFHAEGSGKFFALGAMAAGASAVEAVWMTTNYDPDCGPPVVFAKDGKLWKMEVDNATPQLMEVKE